MGAIIGIIVAAAVFIIGVGIVTTIICVKRKRDNREFAAEGGNGTWDYEHAFSMAREAQFHGQQQHQPPPSYDLDMYKSAKVEVQHDQNREQTYYPSPQHAYPAPVRR